MGIVTRGQAKRMKRSQQSDDQEVPRRGGAPDLISLLPDEVLCSIISLLPTDEGALTQILSSQWEMGRRLRILSQHQGTARRFSASPLILADAAATLDGWLRSPALDNLQELHFSFHPLVPPRSLMPHSALRFSGLLARQYAMLSGCPALNSLTMGYCSGFRQLRINSMSLERIEMSFCSPNAYALHDLIVENAPCLERLHHHGPKDNMHVSIISAPKLKYHCFQGIRSFLCSQLCHFLRLYIRFSVKPSIYLVHTIQTQGFRDVRMVTRMRSVKVLSLRLDMLSLDTFACENTRRRNSQDCFECLDLHLKKLRISYYSGNRSHVDFAKFFALNASVLESLVLDVDRDKKESDCWIKNQRKLLQLKKRASAAAQIDFTSNDYFHFHRDIQMF
ncbi:hypothetical protein BS78_03G105300 [Paspalum vaginatum]|nr:hypothetical protein BS78_03G105300 [Paspalum vaginatum]